VTYPTKGAQLENGQTYPITWEKGLLDGVNFFDLELTRMSSNGLILIARDSASQMASLCRSFRIIEPTFPLSLFLVSSSIGGINLALNSVPDGDDYSLLFINSTHGVLYANSPLFSIVNSGSGNSTVKALSSKPTVTISGGPNPTAQFVTTFPVANGVPPWRPSPVALLSASLMSFALLAGAAVVL